MRSPTARLVADAGLPMARAATVTQAAGPVGPRVRHDHPRHVGGAVWANAGAHGREVRRSSSPPSSCRDGSERRLPAAELGLAYRESRFKTRSPRPRRRPRDPPADPPEIVLGATFALEPAEPDVIKERLDDIRHWRQAHQPLADQNAGSVFRNPPDDPSAGALIDGPG